MKYIELWKYILLSIVTLGIYNIYWLIVTRKDMVARGAHVPSFGWLVWPWVIWLASFFIPVLLEGTTASTILLAISLLGYFALIGIYLWWFWVYSKAVEQLTSKRLEAILTYILLIFLGTIAFVVVQHYFNKIVLEDATSDSPLSA